MKNWFGVFFAKPYPGWICLGILLVWGFFSFQGQQVMHAKEASILPGSENAKVISIPHANGAIVAIENLFVQRYSGPRGSHLESVLSALGATAGFGCQMAIREAYIKTGKMTEKKAFVIVETRDGQKFFYGDLVNRFLLEDNASVGSIVTGGAERAGASHKLDTPEIAGYSATTVGTNQFGVPRLPKDHRPMELPADALRKTWGQVRMILEKNKVEPQYWGMVPAVAAQRVILQTKNQFDPSLAARIVMEAAVPMSKVDPATAIDPVTCLTKK